MRLINTRIWGFILLILSLFGLMSATILVDRPVVFVDENLESAVREILNHSGKPIYRSLLLDIYSLDLSNREITNLEGIEYFRNVETLDLSRNNISDLSPLGQLLNLRKLDLGYNRIVDLEQANFHKINVGELIELNLDHNLILLDDSQQVRLSNLELLSEGVKLQKLSLVDNHIDNLETISGLTKLTELNLAENKLIHLSGLETMSNLQYLNLRENPLENIDAIHDLDQLRYLNLHSNVELNDISPIRDLVELETLILRNVDIEGQQHVFTNLHQLKRLNIRNTGLQDFSFLGQLMENGALQDDKASGIKASINMLNVDLQNSMGDPYRSIRKYWNNITYRYPQVLPFIPNDVVMPRFSHQTGFYNDSFYLTIDVPDLKGRVFYTEDGSEPELTPELEPLGDTKIYQGPILIFDKSLLPNRFSMIETHRLPDYDYYPPSEVFKANVIRAIVVAEDGQRSDVVTNIYFVGSDVNDRYSMPIISITTHPDYLFNEEQGIYVPGQLYEAIPGKHHWFYNANYTQTGLVWERPAYLQLIDPDGELLLSQKIGLRIHGRSTRSFPQKSLRLYGRDESGQRDGLFEYEFFPELSGRFNDQKADTFQTLILRNGGNDWYGTMFRDVLAQNLMVPLKVDIQGANPVVLFLNGEYWGIQNLRNRFDAHYFESYYDIPSDEIVVLTGYWMLPYIGEHDAKDDFLELFRIIDEDFEANDYLTVSTLKDEFAYQKIASRLDVDSFIDYNIAQIFTANKDWPHNNIRYWRRYAKDEADYSVTDYGKDGKWRWIIYDMDFAFESVAYNTLSEATAENNRSTFLFRCLLENEEFKTIFINRFADYLNTLFREEVVSEKINEMYALYSPEINEQIHRWNNLGGSYDAWSDEVNLIRDFSLQRPTYQRSQIIEHFDLPGTMVITTETEPDYGYIRINSIDIEEGTSGVDNPEHWTGIYFKGVPIIISAIPYEGFRFSHWEVDHSNFNSSDVIRFVPEDDIHLVAVFEPVISQ